MKKNLIIILFALIILFPVKVFAKTYNTLDLEATLADEGIERGYKEYKPKSDAITIYLFRGKGCSHCHEFLTFLNSIVDEYGQYFKLESYEVWNDVENGTLMTEVSDYLDANATGVPFIIIGAEFFSGYAKQYDEAIKSTIKALYDTKKSDRYDVMEEMQKYPKKEAESTGTIVFNKYAVWLFIFLFISTTIIVSHINLKFKELNQKVDTLLAQKEVKETSKKEKK